MANDPTQDVSGPAHQGAQSAQATQGRDVSGPDAAAPAEAPAQDVTGPEESAPAPAQDATGPA
jgi:hypothetical protein